MRASLSAVAMVRCLAAGPITEVDMGSRPAPVRGLAEPRFLTTFTCGSSWRCADASGTQEWMRRAAQGRKAMTVRTSLLAIGLLVAAAPAWAANTAAPMAQGQTPAQPQKMPNAAPAAQPQMTAQQQKMRSCN